jgi:hypothetical protein
VDSPDDIDDRLDEIGSRTITSPEAGVAALAQMTALINARIVDSTEIAGTDAFIGDTGERLETWVKRLRAVAEKVVQEFDALGYSITVGIPAGLSVTVSWTPESAGLSTRPG